ncbi:MAG: hypothetical protein J6X55_00280, partial [Victivallales bacterium]|nr:hypothetical protein [Victivallales bacterium]
MVKRIALLILVAAFVCVYAQDLPDLATFKPLPTAASLPVFVEDFNNGWDGWVNQTNNFTWDSHAGMTGTGCLVAERKESKESVSAYKFFKLEHGIHYRL